MAGIKMLGYTVLRDTLLSSAVRTFLTPVRHSMYSALYIKPITDPKRLAEMMESGEAEKLAHLPVLPATTSENSSIYNDPVVRKFTNYLMREGNKVRAQVLVLKMFERIKRIQLQKYHKETDPAEKALIEVDPLKIFHTAIENCKPLLQLNSVKRGGQRYQVPAPIAPNRSSFLSMNWLIEAGKQKDRKTIWSLQMAYELIEAADNKGRVVKKKQDLHKLCEANRAFAHYRWG